VYKRTPLCYNKRVVRKANKKNLEELQMRPTYTAEEIAGLKEIKAAQDARRAAYLKDQQEQLDGIKAIYEKQQARRAARAAQAK
jgi:hypothetical protein